MTACSLHPESARVSSEGYLLIHFQGWAISGRIHVEI